MQPNRGNNNIPHYSKTAEELKYDIEERHLPNAEQSVYQKTIRRKNYQCGDLDDKKLTAYWKKALYVRDMDSLNRRADGRKIRP